MTILLYLSPSESGRLSATRGWGDILPGTLTEGGPATLVAVDFCATHLRRSAHILASLLTRVTPEDVVLTLFQGKTLHQSPHFPS